MIASDGRRINGNGNSDWSSIRDGIDQIGILLAFALSGSRGATRSRQRGRYRLANGRGAAFQGHQSLSQDEYLVVAQLDGTGDWARILAAAPGASARS